MKNTSYRIISFCQKHLYFHHHPCTTIDYLTASEINFLILNVHLAITDYKFRSNFNSVSSHWI